MFGCPAQLAYPISHSCRVDAILSSPGLRTLRHPFDSDVEIATHVRTLSEAIHPRTITGTVALVVAFALKAGALRARTHVSKEDLEILPPRIIGDPPAAVAGIRRVFRVAAARLHRTPRPISA